MVEKSSASRREDGADGTNGARPALDVLRAARAEFAELTGLRAEAVTRLEGAERGWSLEIEVTELARVPDTMSLMASYEITTDADGRVTGYRRLRRYERGRADHG